jgi:hypothetical protein
MTNTEEHTRRSDDQPARQPLEWDSDKKLIAAALSHLELERAGACVIPIPGSEPQLYVAAGPAHAIKMLLGVADGAPEAQGEAAQPAAQAVAQEGARAGRFDRVTPQEDGSFQHSYLGQSVPGPAGGTKGGAK